MYECNMLFLIHLWVMAEKKSNYNIRCLTAGIKRLSNIG